MNGDGRRWTIPLAAVAAAVTTLMVASCRAPEPAAPIGGLARHYTFEAYGPGCTQVSDRVQGGGQLVLQPVRARDTPAETARTTEGREPGRAAALLNRACLAAPGPGAVTGGFTAALWVNVRGQGGLFGNAGTSNGTVAAVGSGYSDGWRITVDTVRRTLSFSIGRPAPPNSLTIVSDPVPLRVWRHVAATWDGRQMRLYIDGALAGRRAFTDPYAKPAQDVLRIGFANAGVGSLEMGVDECMIFSRALSPSEILRLTAPDAPATAGFALAIDDAAESLASSNTVTAADAAARGVRAARGLDPRFRAAALRLAVESARLGGDASGSATGMMALLDMPGLPAPQREDVAAALLSLVRSKPGVSLPRRALEYAASRPDATPADRLNILLLLAQEDAGSGRASDARKRYEEILAFPHIPQPHAAIARLALARLAIEAGETAGATTALQGIAADATAFEAHRDEARRALAALRDPSLATGPRLSPAPAFPKPGIVLHVAPGGSDTNPGTRERPLATLEGARDAIRGLRRKGGLPRGGVAIEIAPGRHTVSATFELTAMDSGAPGAPIVYRAADPARPPEFDGGVRLTGFGPVADAAVRDRLPSESRDRVVEADLRTLGVTNLPPLVLGGYAAGRGFKTEPTPELFFNGEAMPLSRWPNRGFENLAAVHGATEKVAHGIKGCAEGVLSYAGDRPARWLGEDHGLLYGYWFWTWADSYERIESIDPAARRITLAKPWHRYGFRPGAAWCAVNLAAEIDRPGEWSLDPTTLRLRFLPPSDPAAAEVVLSRFDAPMLRAQDIAHVAFVNLTWQYGAADAVVVSRATNCVMAGCVVRHFAGDGIRMEGGVSNAIRSCDIFSLGRGGVSIGGGNRKTLQSGGHAVENCHIHHLSRLHHTYTPAILLSGVGNRIAHNLVHDVSSSAFRISGDHHLVEMNEVFDVVTESDDQGGIDMFGDPTFSGNVFRHNYWHHIGNLASSDATARVGRAAIRLDDAISGVRIQGNIFHRCGAGTGWFGAVQIHGGKDNQIDANVVSHCLSAISLSPWSDARWREHVAKSLQTREIDLSLHTARFPALARLADDANANHIWRNCLVALDRLTSRAPGPNDLAGNAVTDAAGSPYIDAARGDFRLRPGARPPPCLGPVPIPFESMGLRADAYRTTVPSSISGEARARIP